jgi:hypothetical protein
MNSPTMYEPPPLIQYASYRRTGFALIASLIILVTLGLLGVASMTATNTEMQIASSTADVARSFHASEAGLNAAGMVMLEKTTRSQFLKLLSTLKLRDDSIRLDFESLLPEDTPHPLAHFDTDNPTEPHNDLPIVRAVVSGDVGGSCPRQIRASDPDVIACGDHELVSIHTAGSLDAPRGHATTTLRLGVSAERIAPRNTHAGRW